jgi:RNA polymerase sigma factor (TIGR02999 family)
MLAFAGNASDTESIQTSTGLADGASVQAAHWRMNEITLILSTLDEGDPLESERLLPLVYDELRKLAAARLKQEKPGQTLQATALVHEAYLRLVAPDQVRRWANRAHFFAAAAEAMRRILVEEARRKQSQKRGGSLDRRDLDDAQLAVAADVDVLALDEALDSLAARDAEAARLVKLRFFGGMTMNEAAQALDLSTRNAERVWAYARSFLRIELGDPAA